MSVGAPQPRTNRARLNVVGDTRHKTRSVDRRLRLVSLAGRSSDGRVVPGKVSTNLKHPKTPINEWQTASLPGVLSDPDVKPHKTNGVARSAFARPVARRAKWHRPYVLCLIITDLLCAIAASY